MYPFLQICCLGPAKLWTVMNIPYATLQLHLCQVIHLSHIITRLFFCFFFFGGTYRCYQISGITSWINVYLCGYLNHAMAKFYPSYLQNYISNSNSNLISSFSDLYCLSSIPLHTKKIPYRVTTHGIDNDLVRLLWITILPWLLWVSTAWHWKCFHTLC